MKMFFKKFLPRSVVVFMLLGAENLFATEETIQIKKIWQQFSYKILGSNVENNTQFQESLSLLHNYFSDPHRKEAAERFWNEYEKPYGDTFFDFLSNPEKYKQGKNLGYLLWEVDAVIYLLETKESLQKSLEEIRNLLEAPQQNEKVQEVEDKFRFFVQLAGEYVLLNLQRLSIYLKYFRSNELELIKVLKENEPIKYELDTLKSLCRIISKIRICCELGPMKNSMLIQSVAELKETLGKMWNLCDPEVTIASEKERKEKIWNFGMKLKELLDRSPKLFIDYQENAQIPEASKKTMQSFDQDPKGFISRIIDGTVSLGHFCSVAVDMLNFFDYPHPINQICLNSLDQDLLGPSPSRISHSVLPSDLIQWPSVSSDVPLEDEPTSEGPRIEDVD